MAELERKLIREVSDANYRIIVCRFPLPNTVATKVIGGGVDTVWVYESLQMLPKEKILANP